jgi:ribosomal protein S27AE
VELTAWRDAHPAATLDAIEDAVEAGLAQLRQRLTTDTVHASAVAAVGTGGTRARCPECGARLQRKGFSQRRVQTGRGTEVVLDREYGWCPRCAAGVFPP